MRRVWCAAVALLVAGCGIQPTGVTDGGEAPTGVAPGVTLYFVGADGELRPRQRDTGGLGSISEALSLLLSGPGGSGLRTGIAPISVQRVGVTIEPGVIELVTPLTIDDVTPLGIDQIVCTALDTHVRSGGSRDMRVRVRFTQPTPETDELRTCPLIR
ncbi:hypothetical protein [Nocardiopsis halotolerans]|uniref:hypothetical protein n=1 Tax=Nocardiopsis halotolerans TaxID=124252 RepID=UPI0004765FC8|nr:hypothetical protein [Nocardiopsis halotolerans]